MQLFLISRFSNQSISFRQDTSAASPTSAVRLHTGFSINNDEEATKSLLSRRSKKMSDKAEAAKELEKDPNKVGKSSLVSMLSELSNVTERMKELSKKLASQALSPEQTQAIRDEISGLQAQYSQAVQSDLYKKITEIAKQVSSNLANGGTTSASLSALKQYRSILGPEFLGIVQRGDLNRLSTLQRSLLDISETNPSVGDLSALNKISAAIKSAAQALDGMTYQEEEKEITSTEVIPTVTELPSPTEMIFEGPGDIALSLKSFSSDDLFKMAAAHADLDSLNVLTLVIPPKDEEDKRKEEEEKDLIS